ncbi:MAG: tetratricopeptide repeat protein [Verrucomicrobiota bacterium]
MAVKISAEESQQLLRTIEMFEAIADNQPDDYQSLEILKEAYCKLGRKADGYAASKRLAAAYVKIGQISQAVLEYESLAQEYPNDADVKSALAQLESKTAPSATSASSAAPPLAVHSKPTQTPAGVPAGVRSTAGVRTRPEDGDIALSQFLIAEKLITQQAIDPLLAKLREMRQSPGDSTEPLSLVPLLVAEQLMKFEDLLLVMIEKSKLPYMPLSIYDADREIVRQVPQDICWQHCLTPFDVISRSILIATANPFDLGARKQVEAMLDLHVFWFISPPSDIVSILRSAHGMDKKQANQS